jgi:hypothetical protein
MKIYGKEVPADLEIPELDDESKAEVDALHAKLLKKEAEMAEFRKKHKSAYTLTEEEAWRRMHPNSNEPPPRPGVNFDALRQLPPRTRALFVYIHREDVTY